MACPCSAPASLGGVAALLLGPIALAGNPTVGPQVRVDPGAGTARVNETTASASDLFPDRVVMGWNDYRQSGLIQSGFSLSFDGGQTFDDFILRPPLQYQGSVEGDPMTGFDDRTGTLWAGAISFTSSGGMYVARLNPGETEFEPAVMADLGFVDKCWLAAGPRPAMPDTTRVYIAYNLGVIRSDDMGDTWTDPVAMAGGIGFQPRVGPNGEVYVAYWDFGSGMLLMRSLNGGASFTTHTIATRMDVWGTQDGSRFPGGFRVPSLVYIDVDQNDGTLYAVYFDTTDIVDGNANVDLYFTKSIDQGTTWTTPVVVNNDATRPGDQFFPWIEVDAEGRVHIVFFDTRNVVQDDNDAIAFIDAYYQFSEDGGTSWTEFRLTPNSWSNGGQGFIGDYNGMASAGGKLYPCYIDMSAGDEDAFTNVIEFEDTCPWDCGDDNGSVDTIDFLQLLADWGVIDAPCDFSGGGVDAVDFLELLENWGPCP
jgi:hypothetical protein